MNNHNDEFYKKVKETFKLNQEIRALFKKNKKYGFDFPFESFLYSMALQNPQSYGSRLESFVIEKFNLQRVSSTDGLGDFEDSLCKKYELKVSLITVTNDALNMVQIRPWQGLSGYLMVAFDLRAEPIKLYAFQLTKEQLINETKLMKATSAHGNKKAVKNNQTVELRMSLKIDPENEHFQRWCENYLNHDLSKKFSTDK